MSCAVATPSERARKASFTMAEPRLVVIPLEKRLGDGEVDVVAYEVGELQGPHAEPGPAYRRVDLLGLAPNLDEPERLQVKRPGDPVHDEPRRVGDPDRRLAQAFGEFLRAAHDRGVRGRSGDHLDEAHRRHRVEEVHARHAFGAFRGRRDPGDGERGGVRCENRVATNYVLEVGEDLLLDLHVLDHGLYDQRRVGAIVEGGRRRDPVEHLPALVLREPPPLYPALQVSLDGLPAAGQGVLLDVQQHRRHARKRGALRDPRPHGPRPHDRNIDHPDLRTARTPLRPGPAN
jgi:hypothetical protein